MAKRRFGFFLDKFMKVKGFILIFLVVQIIFGAILTTLLSSAVSGMINTVATIKFPYSIIRKEYNASNPWVEYSFFVRNENIFELDSFQAEVSIDILYTNKSDGSPVRSEVYEKTSTYYNIPSEGIIYYLINGTRDYFKIIELDNFWAYADLNKTVSSLIHGSFRGLYLGGLVNFRLGVFNQNISRFEILW